MKRFLQAAQELGEEMGKLEMRLKEGTEQVEGEEVEESRRRIQELYLQVGGQVNIRISSLIYPAGVLRRRLLHRNGNFVPLAP